MPQETLTAYLHAKQCRHELHKYPMKDHVGPVYDVLPMVFECVRFAVA